MVNNITPEANPKIPTANIIAVFLIFGVILSGTALYGMQEFGAWQEHGIATKASILDKYMDEDCQTGSSSSNTCLDVFILEYSYQVTDGDGFTAKDSVNQTIWNKHPIGSDVDLLYLAHKPQTSSINFAYDLDFKIGLWRFVLGLGVLLIIIGLFITKKVIAKKSK